MTKPHLIALTGPAGCGKDTVADILEAQHGYTGRLAFADPIRHMIAALFQTAGIDPAYMLERNLKERPIPGLMGISYRKLAQTLGTEWGREQIDRRFWVALASRRLANLDFQGHTHVVITDLRFNDVEVQWVREMGGQIWRVVREVPSVRYHVSELETHAICQDRTLYNLGSLDELRVNVAELMREAEA